MAIMRTKLTEDKNGRTWLENRNGSCFGLTEFDMFQNNHGDNETTVVLGVRGKRGKWLRGGLAILRNDFIKICKQYLELCGYEVKEKTNA
jgi:hypothetical protein